jgi:hypothetical protein
MQRRRAGGLDDAAHHILGHKGAEIADVRRTIDRGAAAVEAQRLPSSGVTSRSVRVSVSWRVRWAGMRAGKLNDE